jgi:chemotaxis protein MotB
MAEPRRVIVKKKGGHAAHHGGAWKVAYADFVTAMMALFMVMWLLASTDQASRKEISHYFRTGILPSGDLAMNRAAQARPSVIEETGIPPPQKSTTAGEKARELGKAITRMVKSDPALAKLAAQVSISVTQEGVLIEAIDRDGQSMLFDLASSSLKPGLTTFLGKLGPLLASRPNKVRIMGHTDALPYASKVGKSNWDLSYERATNARRVLEASGLARGQITAVQAHGPSMPRNAADPYAAENRRLAVLVLDEPEAPATEASPAQEGSPAAAPVAAPVAPPAAAPVAPPTAAPASPPAAAPIAPPAAAPVAPPASTSPASAVPTRDPPAAQPTTSATTDR